MTTMKTIRPSRVITEAYMKRIFESERISYVEVDECLVDDYLVMINDNENVNRFIGRGPHDPFTAEQELAWVRRKLEQKDPVFSMIEKNTGAFIGNTEFMDVSEKVRELGIALTAAKQNMGYGTEAVRAMLRHGFEDMGLEKIVLRADPDNARAIHVYEKCGFQEYKRDEEHVYMETCRCE